MQVSSPMQSLTLALPALLLAMRYACQCQPMLVHKHNTLATIRSLWRFIDSFAQLVASEDNAKWFKYAAYAMTAFSVIFLLVLIGASHLSGLDGLLVALTLVMHCVCVYVCVRPFCSNPQVHH